METEPNDDNRAPADHIAGDLANSEPEDFMDDDDDDAVGAEMEKEAQPTLFQLWGTNRTHKRWRQRREAQQMRSTRRATTPVGSPMSDTMLERSNNVESDDDDNGPGAGDDDIPDPWEGHRDGERGGRPPPTARMCAATPLRAHTHVSMTSCAVGRGAPAWRAPRHSANS